MSKNFDTAETIAELDGEKSNLLMEAYVLIGTGEPEQAIERYALAAPMEVRIAAFYQKQGDAFMATRHRFSAAVCYAKSGSLRDALKLFDAMGRDRDIPEYKGDALMWAARLRQKQRESLQAYGHSLQSVG